jgi:YVTN family beta-propeller protein/probable HAF family extracellular repeat protein
MTSYIYTNVDFPGAANSNALGINDLGQIIGAYQDASGHSHGYLYSAGIYVSLDGPVGSTNIYAQGLNDLGDIVGRIDDLPFLYHEGAYSTLSYDSATTGVAYAVNNEQQVVGFFRNGTGTEGFIYDQGTYTLLNDPSSANFTIATAINNSGQVVGFYFDEEGHRHGFLYANGTYTTIDDPLADPDSENTIPASINDNGDVVGVYVDADRVSHGFLYHNGAFTAIDAPLAGPNGTFANSITASGEIVGAYVDNSGGPVNSYHGGGGTLQGFILQNGVYTAFQNPAAGDIGTALVSGNNNQQFVGYYFDPSGNVHAILAHPAYAYVPNEYDNTVSVIDTSNNSVVATIPVAGNYADGVAVSPNGKFAYVASESGVVSVIDTASQTVSATIAVGLGADFVAFSPDSTRAYVTHYGGNSVAVIDTSSNSVVADITVSNTYAVAVSPDGSRAYVTSENSAGTVAVIDTSSNTVIDNIAVGASPTGIAVSPDGTLVYADNNGSGTVSVINTATNSVVGTISVGGNPYGVVFSPDGSHAYVANNDGIVSVIDTATNSVVDTINVGGQDVGIAITPDGADLYVSHYKSSDTVSVIDTKTDTVVDTVNVGRVPEYLAIEPCCFWRGTLINTPDGYMKVEDLKVGQLVETVNGPPKRVVWLGTQTLSKRFSDPLRALPIRVRKDALADNVPSTDLMLSPDHAIFLDGILIQAGALVNGVSIVRETKVPDKFVYYHVELDEHALLVAENTPVESFVDNSDRLAFDNWAQHEALYPDGKPIDELPYPRAKSHRQVPMRTRTMLAARAAGILGEAVEAA